MGPRANFAPESEGLRGLRIGGWQMRSLRSCDFTTSGPLTPRLRPRIRNLHEKRRRTHPSRASGTNFEAVPGPGQFQVRTREAMLHLSLIHI
eukprot:6014054-Alexandrium_andersonii.AAC.1